MPRKEIIDYNGLEMPVEYKDLYISPLIHIKPTRRSDTHRDVYFTLVQQSSHIKYNPALVQDICRLGSDRSIEKMTLSDNPFYTPNIASPFQTEVNDEVQKRISTYSPEDLMQYLQYYGCEPDFAEAMMAQLPPGIIFSFQSAFSDQKNIMAMVRRYSGPQIDAVPYEAVLAKS